MKIILLLLFFPLVGWATKVYVLCYHTFSTNAKVMAVSSYNFTPDIFEKQVSNLLGAGYRFVSWQDIMSNRVEGEKNILITIDDANVSVRNVEGIFDRYGIRGILFVYPAIVGRVHYALTYEDLQRLQSKGWVIGGHGYNHLYVNEKLYREDSVSFFREIRLPKQVLEKKMLVPVTLYAYPFGAYSAVTISNLYAEHYEYAFTIAGKPWVLPAKDNYQIPRYLMTPSMWKHLVSLLISKQTIAHREEEVSHANAQDSTLSNQYHRGRY